ncbi:MAG TPA: ABC transporter ATP-binding protein [Blastocatellia bacterium]|nr:ABC transporter ATP-binding protein [Blastocatellia bacterium]
MKFSITAMDMNAIEVKDLKKVYRSNTSAPVRALDGISFLVPQGCVFGLLGPNGAGKSTLVKILTTITSPSSGEATVLGRDVTRSSLEVRRQIAVVLQQTAVESLLTVKDNLLIYAYLHGVGRREAWQRMRSLVEEFDLADKLHETVYDLSIGTKRRVQVAKIFMLDSPVIFLDEATTGMDPFMKRRVMDRIRLEARNGRTVLLTTQVLSEAEQLCDTILIIDRGQTLASGTLQDLRRLSEQMFRVSLSFAGIDGDLVGRLESLNPVELKADGKSVEMLFRGKEASLLGELADISRSVPITHFEIRGADLEEIFMALVKESL